MKLWYVLPAMMFVFGCQVKKMTYYEQILSEWNNKTVVFPDLEPVSLPDKQTYFIDSLRDYKILLYIDSSGCTKCKLGIDAWKQYIEELGDKVNFMFWFYHPSERILLYQLSQERFYCPVYIDRYDSLNKLNHFPSDPLFQCVLLDRNNKTLTIGNPVRNPRIWALFKSIVNGEIEVEQILTTVEPTQTELFINNLQVGKTSESAFTLKNTGSQPLVVQMVNASCGCTVPEWDKQPVMPGKTAKVRVRITPENAGYFNKTVTVHCNTEKGSIALKVSGTVKQNSSNDKHKE